MSEEKKKGFFKKLLEKFDKKLKEKANEKTPCCCEKVTVENNDKKGCC